MRDKRIQNKKARFDYEITDSFEAGIVLVADEIKAVRSGRVDLRGSYAKIISHDNAPELFLIGSHFHTEVQGHDPQRSKKLLVHKSELTKLVQVTQEKGLTLVPLTVYLKRGKAKVEIGIGRGKKKFDKRETLKARDAEQKIKQETKLRNK
ncbi:SsrA-binding protein [Candidatus Berkelbacteria bacterium CG10_big_fil_rev_8_21_14_0_10_41_12]|uniref:SsrA-binding protein n=1 Tax=Candidatus Berkelbacteria bacterium CG10_big_fil_rev_8_21_14_0_10_41_12 TaxID=1974513 RepID=A0A2M6WXX5_9BACT|nr:MAG: SsrA-binding protein [Candidatus Berkelbacteria bacterium CG10_big_fil_rev_8_21_14_0_10_41_12]